jgi:hypothetical protein
MAAVQLWMDRTAGTGVEYPGYAIVPGFWRQADIGGDHPAIAQRGNRIGRGRIAIAVDDQAGIDALHQRGLQSFGDAPRDVGRADIPADMIKSIDLGHAQIPQDMRYRVAGVIADDEPVAVRPFRDAER